MEEDASGSSTRFSPLTFDVAPIPWWLAALPLYYIGRDFYLLIRIWSSGKSPSPALLAITGFLVLVLVGMLTSAYRRMVVDPAAKKVFRKTLFGSKAVADFAEISDVRQVESGRGKKIHYAIFGGTPALGAGLRITKAMSGEAAERFEKETLPVLRSMLGLQ